MSARKKRKQQQQQPQKPITGNEVLGDFTTNSACTSLDGAPIVSPSEVRVLTIGDKMYALTHFLGKGTYGNVYAANPCDISTVLSGSATHVRTDQVAVKLFNDVRIPRASLSAQERHRVVGTYYNELALLTKVGPHPNIIGLKAAAMHPMQPGGECALVLEKMPRDLSQWVPISFGHLMNLIALCAQGLDALHCAGFVHADIKPENILENPITGEVKLADFSLSVEKKDAFACTEISKITTSMVIVPGTVWYRCPEAMGYGCGIPPMLSAAADIWSLGVVITHLLMHRAAFAFEKEDAGMYNQATDAGLSAATLQRIYEEFGFPAHAINHKFAFIARKFEKQRAGRVANALAEEVKRLCVADPAHQKEAEMHAQNFSRLWQHMTRLSPLDRLSAREISETFSVDEKAKVTWKKSLAPVPDPVYPTPPSAPSTPAPAAAVAATAPAAPVAQKLKPKPLDPQQAQ